jgi:hypothetical protein
VQIAYALISQIADKSVSDVTAANDFIIRKTGVTLKDAKIFGDLIVAQGVGNGDVTLENVKVTGKLIAYGGGQNSIHITGNTEIRQVVLAKPESAGSQPVSLKVESAASIITDVTVESGNADIQGKVETLTVAPEAAKSTVTVTNATITEITISAPDAVVALEGASVISTVTVTETATTAVVEVQGTTTVTTVTTTAVSTTVTVSKEAAIETTEVKADGAKVGGEGYVATITVATTVTTTTEVTTAGTKVENSSAAPVVNESGSTVAAANTETQTPAEAAPTETAPASQPPVIPPQAPPQTTPTPPTSRTVHSYDELIQALADGIRNIYADDPASVQGAYDSRKFESTADVTIPVGTQLTIDHAAFVVWPEHKFTINGTVNLVTDKWVPMFIYQNTDVALNAANITKTGKKLPEAGYGDHLFVPYVFANVKTLADAISFGYLNANNAVEQILVQNTANVLSSNLTIPAGKFLSFEPKITKTPNGSIPDYSNPDNAGLTINAGVTLTVSGTLNIPSTRLTNNGTITLPNAEWYEGGKVLLSGNPADPNDLLSGTGKINGFDNAVIPKISDGTITLFNAGGLVSMFGPDGVTVTLKGNNTLAQGVNWNVEGTLIVPTGTTLTIEKGASLWVNHNLELQGTGAIVGGYTTLDENGSARVEFAGESGASLTVGSNAKGLVAASPFTKYTFYYWNGAAWVEPFQSKYSDHWAIDAMNWLNDLTWRLFLISNPAANLTRGELVDVLYMYEKNGGDETDTSDLAKTWATTAQGEGANSITLVTGDGNNYNWTGTVDRGTAVAILAKYAQLRGWDVTPGANAPAFTDVPEANWNYAAVQWAAENGIVNGTGDGTFNPTGLLTHAQLAALISNFDVWAIIQWEAQQG